MNPLATADPDPHLRGLHVVAVDDEQTTLRLLKDMLHGMGVECVTAFTDGRRLADLLIGRPSSIDVVLCDWSMPKMSGLEVLRLVRASHPDLPFLMVTGSADVSSVLEAKSNGVTAYIKKPFSNEELRKKLAVIARVKAHRLIASA